MIKGIHHVSMKCTVEEIDKVKDFYVNVLGMTLCREWDGGMMFDTGSGIVEIFTNRAEEEKKGIIGHMAFLVDNVDEMVDRVKAAGYDVFVGPADVVIASDPPFPIRMAFCHGPLGEEIELFYER